ncbi:MAG: hypothetical protein KGV44_05210 [Flavobacteriaceae bacterium]|nr:hypothetical protein [Flavobacteriaceae bacterium]
MEWQPTKKLLDRYFEGMTSTEEEKQLKHYFSSNNVADEFQKYQPLFSFFKEEKEVVHKKIIALPKKNYKYQFLKIAATLLLPLSVYLGYQKYQEYQAEQIYQTSMTALTMLSSNLKKGNEAIAKLQNFENVKNKIFTYKK